MLIACCLVSWFACFVVGCWVFARCWGLLLLCLLCVVFVLSKVIWVVIVL